MTEKIEVSINLEDLASGLLLTIGKKLDWVTMFDPEKKPLLEGVMKSMWFEIYYLNTPDGTVEIKKGDFVIKTTENEFYRIEDTRN